MKAFLIVCFACLCLPVWASVGVDSTPATQPAQAAVTLDVSVSTGTTATYMPARPSTQRVTVQRVAPKNISAADQCEIDKLIAHYGISGENARFLREQLPIAISTGMIDARDSRGVIILNQSATHYVAMLQTYLAVMNGTDWYVNIPRQCLPPFTPGQSCPDLCAPTFCTDFSCEKVCAVAGTAIGAREFGSEAKSSETLVAGFNRSTFKEREHRKWCPPDNCPEEGPGPGGGPTPPPPPCDVP